MGNRQNCIKYISSTCIWQNMTNTQYHCYIDLKSFCVLKSEFSWPNLPKLKHTSKIKGNPAVSTGFAHKITYKVYNRQKAP